MCTNPGLIESLECYMDDLVDCFEDFVTKSLVIISLAIGALMVMIAYALRVATGRNLFSAFPSGNTTSDSFRPEPGGMTGSETTTNYSQSTQSAMESMSSPRSDPQFENARNKKIQNAQHEKIQNSQNEKIQNAQNEKIRQARSSGANAMSTPTQDVNMSLVTNESQNTSSHFNATNNGILHKKSTPSFDEKILLSIGLTGCSTNCSRRSLKRNNSTSRIIIRSQPTCIPNCHLSKSRPCSRYIQMKSSCCSMCCADDDKR